MHFNSALVFSALAVMFSAASATTLGQTNYYDDTVQDCNGKTPIMATSSVNPSCAPAQCGPSNDNRYNLGQGICNNNLAIDLTGSKRNYVVRQVYGSSESCAGDVSSAIAVAADAQCHPLGGDSKSYFFANCNGAKPIFKYCQDSGCNNCTETIYTTQCNLLGAGASLKVQCLRANSRVGVDGTSSGYNSSDDDSDSAASLLTLATAGVMGAAAFVGSFVAL